MERTVVGGMVLSNEIITRDYYFSLNRDRIGFFFFSLLDDYF